VAVWVITALLVLATIPLMLDDPVLVSWFLGISLTMGLLIPAWKFRFLSTKIHLPGPWDIPNAATMQLEFRLTADQ
jgi:hypothetical protein